jgi:LmbE family N-acetylglucosaminyl deacetylase
MTIMAHPDDAELWAGGTLALHAADGAEITIVVAHHDDVRDAEAAAAASILGARLHQVERLDPTTIANLLVARRPEVVITHSTDDIHPEHRAAAQALTDALPEPVIATGRPCRVYTCDGYNNLDKAGRPLDLPIIIDITSTVDTKAGALRAHQSQPIAGHFGPMAENLSRLHGHRIGAAHAEAFRPIPILGRLPATSRL